MFYVFQLLDNWNVLQYSVLVRSEIFGKNVNFWANFTNFEPEINLIKSKTEKLKQKT